MECHPDQQHMISQKKKEEKMLESAHPPHIQFSTSLIFYSLVKENTNIMQKHPHRPMHNEVFFFLIFSVFLNKYID